MQPSILFSGAVALALVASPVVSAQGKGKAYEPPRLSDGKPDLNGIWSGPAIINNDIQAAKVSGKSVIVDPPNGKIP